MNRTRRAVRGWLATAVVGLLLAGCAPSSGPVTRSTEGSGGTGTTAPPAPTVAASQLEASKAAAGIADCPPSDPAVPARADGLPDLTLPCLGGGRTVRLAGLRGTPLVVNVWAQWCPPCRQEAPHLTEASQQLAGRVAFLGIDYNDPRPELAIAFADEAGWRYPQVTDEDRAVQPPFQLVGPPMTLFVTADGRIAHRHPGMVTSTEQLLQLVTQHLGVS